MGTLEDERSLFEDGFIQNEGFRPYTGDGSVDINGKPVLKKNTGNWKACFFILVPALGPAECLGFMCPSSTFAQSAVFLFGLYLVALGTGGIKPCVLPFGADQFDDTNLKERVKKASFFNWYYFAICSGVFVSGTFLVWIQDNVGWGLGFGVPAFFMGIAIAVFLSGTALYRFQKPQGSPVTRICQVLVASCRKWNLELPKDSSLLYETEDKSSAIERTSTLGHSGTLKFLDKAAVISDAEISHGDFSDSWRLCTVTQVEELKTLVRLLPILATGISVAVVYAQISTMFVEQGMMMDTTIGSFTIPVASFSCLDVICVLVLVPIYDRVVVPIARRFTGNEKGFSELQRIGIGLFFSVLCMAAAAIVEANRLQLAKELDLVDKKVAVPLSIFWQVPQYLLVGITEMLTYIAQTEFFYEESPNAMRSLCSALLLLSLSLGYYLSSFILTVVTYFTRNDGKGGWITDNLNEGHLDYYFWLLACLSFLNLLVFVVCAKKFKPKKGS
ncbi:hypothetical protein TIFTF001_031003 [Ficus carica]|uniref:Uncharacterized protein n=1 Tax=Ficus carica TaxID=3494 RepID=A0AA88DUQ5_FICCA|nr:hypothetical protein TIFTF001_031003 [Ficus carica]